MPADVKVSAPESGGVASGSPVRQPRLLERKASERSTPPARYEGRHQCSASLKGMRKIRGVFCWCHLDDKFHRLGPGRGGLAVQLFSIDFALVAGGVLMFAKKSIGLVALTLLSLLLATAPVQAAVIISDGFTGDGPNNSGRT